jgi:tryptophan synthase alpha chain
MNGIERIARSFRASRTAFMPYAVLGYPTVDASLDVTQTLAEAGADLLELGVPFSDPLADGPVIQAATQRALENGVTLAQCIALTAELRSRGVQTPVLLMGYVNPILSYGTGRFVADSARAGVDGFIVPDLPPEEATDLENACRLQGLALVYLLATTSPAERLAWVADKSQGFIYLVSVTGVTGVRSGLSPDLAGFLARVRRVTDKPLAVGFGIGTSEQARSVAHLADGVIVGSALVRLAGESADKVRHLATELSQAIHDSAGEAGNSDRHAGE